MISEEKAARVSPVHDAYSAPTPEAYMGSKDLKYDPKAPIIPEYCNVLLDVAALFGNTTLAAMYGWNFERSCEFWKDDKPLTEDQRAKTLVNKRMKTIAIDGAPLALQYGKKMNIFDEFVVQNFTKPMLPGTELALSTADMWTMQCCISYMPLENLQKWIEIFMRDRSRPKRIVYDCNPFFDDRELTPEKLFGKYPQWSAEPGVFYPYREKTDDEYAKSAENGRGMFVYHFVVDFEKI